MNLDIWLLLLALTRFAVLTGLSLLVFTATVEALHDIRRGESVRAAIRARIDRLSAVLVLAYFVWVFLIEPDRLPRRENLVYVNTALSVFVWLQIWQRRRQRPKPT